MKTTYDSRRSPFLGALLVAAALAPWAPAAARAPAQEDAKTAEVAELPGARSIVDRFLEVTHHAARVEAGGYHVKGKATIVGFGIQGPFESYSTPSQNYTRVDLGAAGTVESGYDGKVGWRTHPMLGPALLEGGELLQARLDADLRAAAKDDHLYESIETVGRQEFEGVDCYVVRAVAKPLPGMDPEESTAVRTSTEYYEVDSGYLRGTVFTADSPMGSQEVTVVQTDYRPFGKCVFPVKSTQKAEAATIEITLDTVELGAPDPVVFALPEAIRLLVEAEAGETVPAGG